MTAQVSIGDAGRGAGTWPALATDVPLLSLLWLWQRTGALVIGSPAALPLARTAWERDAARGGASASSASSVLTAPCGERRGMHTSPRA